jgi:hypothetical protein
MAHRWTVVLDRRPSYGEWPAGYFPRRFHYKRDAFDLVEQVESYGGVAHVEITKHKPSETSGERKETT